jgi:hypothetical protein
MNHGAKLGKHCHSFPIRGDRRLQNESDSGTVGITLPGVLPRGRCSGNFDFEEDNGRFAWALASGYVALRIGKCGLESFSHERLGASLRSDAVLARGTSASVRYASKVIGQCCDQHHFLWTAACIAHGCIFLDTHSNVLLRECFFAAKCGKHTCSHPSSYIRVRASEVTARGARAPLPRTRAAVATSGAGPPRDYFTGLAGFASNFKTPRTNENVG